MKRISVTYRTLEPHGDGVRMVIKTEEFRRKDQNAVLANCGYSAEGSSLMRFYGGGRQLLLKKDDLLHMEADE